MTPTTLAAIRRLDDARLWQFCVLLEDFGWPVAEAWLAAGKPLQNGENQRINAERPRRGELAIFCGSDRLGADAK